MEKNIIFRYVFISFSFLFVLNFVASKLHWYSSMWYFDIIMHTLGGIALGFSSVWFFYNDIKKISFSRKFFLKIMVFVFLISFAWELYEILVNFFFAKDSFDLIDTLSDLFSDLSGGAIIFIVLKNIFKKDKIMYN